MPKKLNFYPGEKRNFMLYLENLGGGEGRFQCDCGNVTIKHAKDVNSGRVKSCGCMTTALKTAHIRSPENEAKRKAGLRAKYGSLSAFSDPKTHKKSRETNLIRYGAEKPLESKEVLNKMQANVKAKYGVDNVMQVREIAAIQRQQVKEDGRAKMLPNGKTLSEHMEDVGIPYRPNAHTVYRVYGPDVAQKWIETYKESKSSLEIFAETHLKGLEHYNKTPPELKAIGVYRRPDFKVTDKLYVDVDGVEYHNEEWVDDNNHFRKREMYEKAGLRILQFYQEEIVDKTAIVQSMIDSLTGKATARIFARKCEVRTVDNTEAKAFFTRTHLMGHTPARTLALYFNGAPVCMLSFKVFRGHLEIIRFSSELGTQVVGGLSRLMAALPKEGYTDIVSFVDLRYVTGHSLTKLGFTCQRVTQGFKWSDGHRTYNRLQCRANMDYRCLTEKQHAAEKGWTKIFDAGQARFVKTL